MNVEEVGSTQCNIADDSQPDFWWRMVSWDEGQNCLCGCISIMKGKKLENACCEAVQKVLEGDTECRFYHSVEVIKGDENSTDKKAVNCKGTLGLY